MPASAAQLLTLFNASWREAEHSFFERVSRLRFILKHFPGAPCGRQQPLELRVPLLPPYSSLGEIVTSEPDKALVIVESPTKAKTISRFLGSQFIVEASMGHVRDLPSSAAEIPTKFKKEKWARIGVKVEEDFKPLYIIPSEKKKKIQELKSLLKGVDRLYIATDEDREGESIGWHLLEVLKPKVPVYRMAFHEITEAAISRALASPRAVDLQVVRAQEARRVLDRLVGYLVSPLLWKKVNKNLLSGSGSERRGADPCAAGARPYALSLRLLVGS